MLSPRCTKFFSGGSKWCGNASNQARAAFSTWLTGSPIKANLSDAKFHLEPSRISLSTRYLSTGASELVFLNRIYTDQSCCIKRCTSHHTPKYFSYNRNGFLRYASSGNGSACAKVGDSSAGQVVSGSSFAGAAGIDNKASLQSFKGRFQEEVAQSSDYDSSRIDLGKLISSPSELKGLHASLQTSSRSSGDKQIMSMTIEDIQNILKGEFRRRASQTASVEIWKALVVVSGLLFVLYWGRIGKEVADQTARVTTLTLEDEQLQAKAFELANVIVNNVLTNHRVADQAAVFLQIAVANLTAKPETQAVLLQITQSTLAQLIAQESTLALISDLLGRAAIQALDDPSVKSKVADTIAWVLQEKYVVDQSAKLASSASVETLADEVVQKQSKEFIEHILDDPTIKKKTAAAVWGVIGNMFIPAFFTKDPSSASKTNAEQQIVPTPVSYECDVTPWYHFSGVLGWVLPSFRKRSISVPVPKQDNITHNSVSDTLPISSNSMPDGSAGVDMPPTSTVGQSPTRNNDVCFEKQSATPSVSVPAALENLSGAKLLSEARNVPNAQIPRVPTHVALLVPPSSAEEGDSSFTDDDRRGANIGQQKD